MNDELIRKYANLMNELDLTGLEIEENNTKIRLERTVTVAAAPAAVQVETKEASEADTSSGFDKVVSPMVGVFYAAPAENADVFVKVGDSVKKGDTLCIIEAMKLMNEVTAERDGVIQEVCVKNGQTVEFGTVLFLMS